MPTFVYSEMFLSTIGKQKKLRALEMREMREHGAVKTWVVDTRPTGDIIINTCSLVESMNVFGD